MSTGFSSANLSSIFQTSYANALQGKNALGSTSSLASSALFGSLAPGSNPLAPLQGQTAVMGLSSFVAGLQQSYAARKAASAAGSATDPSALLSSLTGGSGSGSGSASGMSSSDMLSALSSMLGMLGGGGSSSGSSSGLNSSLLNGFSSSGSGSSTLGFDQTGLGNLTGLNALNGTYQYPNSGSSASAFDVSADQTSTALASQLQSMLPALTSMMSMLGGASSGSKASAGGASSAASMLPQLQSMLSTLTSLMGGSGAAGAGTNAAYSPNGSGAAGATSPYSPYGASAATTNSLTGANPLSSPTLFNQQVNMNLIDSAINQTLGSISNTLPMVRM